VNPWHWLTRPDPTPGFTTGKLLKLLARILIFAVIATVLSSLLQMTPLKPYLETWWGSLIFVLILYIPAAKLLSMNDMFIRPAPRGAAPGKAQTLSSAARRKERHRYAGVKKSAPRQGGRR
jgi:hypothetical protein